MCMYDVTSAGTYWRYPFRALMVASQMGDYVVLAIDKVVNLIHVKSIVICWSSHVMI
jgi:hypothetical protein